MSAARLYYFSSPLLLASGMKASVEIDLLLHLGCFKNVNLLSRGIYRVKVSLVCGSQKIIPVGMFAAPSTFHSFVDQQEIETLGMVTPAEVDEEQHCFVGRALVIRYKGEKHELNEGVHWRFTVHDLDLGSQVQGPKLNQLLGVKFELQFCDFLDEKDTKPEFGDDFRRFIPMDPQFETVSVQRLMIQSLTSGLHQLYSVSFDGDHFSSLDAMFHACISSIHYTEFHHNSILPSSNTSAGNPPGAAMLVPTPIKGSKRMSTTIEKDRPETTSSRGGIFKLLASPEKLLFGSPNGVEKTKAEEGRSNVFAETIQKGGALFGLLKNDAITPGTSSNGGEGSSTAINNCIHPGQSINEDQTMQLFKFFTAPIILNYQRSVQQSQFIINDFLVGNSRVASSGSGKHVYDIETYNKHPESLNSQGSKCILLANDDEILDTIKGFQTFQDLSNEINRNVEICNTILSLRWTLIVNSLKHIMKPVKKYLMKGFLQETSAFWKQQQMIYTRNIGGAHHLTSNKDEDVLETLMIHIKFERENDIVACTVRDQLRDDDGLYSSTAKSALPVYARGMSIFDTETHMIPSRLPYLFVEQYIPDPTPDGSTDTDCNSNHSIFRGLHVIFLQHGFMGTSYDMRQISQALNLLCPENTLIYALKNNELCGQESIQEMADKLASEIYDYCAGRAPEVLDEQLNHSQCRLSFVGHSLGSVMIRLALQNPNLNFLRNKLHLFVSLASPHIGNLFAESQLVSTGMWALSKFKNCQSLKELVMEDDGTGVSSTPQGQDSKSSSQSQKKEKDKENSLLYNISKFKTFSLFKKVVLVSCPKDQYVPFYSARIQTTPRIMADSTNNGLSSNGGIVCSMVHNLLDCLQPHQLLRVTVMNYNSSIHVPPRFDDKAAKIEKERKHEIRSTNQVASLLLKENDATVFDVNSMIGRSAHICYLESPIVAYQLMLSLQRYFIDDQMPK